MREEFLLPEGEGFVGVADIVKDDDNNLWMTNGYADEPLAVLRPDGSWESFSLEGNFDSRDVLTRMIVSQEGDLWMIHNRGGIVAFSPTQEEGSDNLQLFKSGNGNGGLPVDEVFSIAEDLDGEIWVGTSDGVAVFYSPFDAFSNDPSDARQILVEQDGIFQFYSKHRALAPSLLMEQIGSGLEHSAREYFYFQKMEQNKFFDLLQIKVRSFLM